MWLELCAKYKFWKTYKFTNARYVQGVQILSDISNFDIMVRKNGQI